MYAAANYKRRTSSTGVAWAACADVLWEVPLYQYCIVGGDDYAWYLAFMYDKADIQKVVKEQENQHFFKHARPEFMSHYLQWAEHCASLVKQNVGYVKQTVFSCPHGKLRDRYYSIRQGVLHYFDPCNDVTYEAGGPLCWASRKPELHQVVADYFYHRNEDLPPNSRVSRQKDTTSDL